VAIANALHLEAARASTVLFRFIYDAMPSLKLPNHRGSTGPAEHLRTTPAQYDRR